MRQRNRGLKNGYGKRKWGFRIGWGRVKNVPKMVAEEKRVSPKWSQQFFLPRTFSRPISTSTTIFGSHFLFHNQLWDPTFFFLDNQFWNPLFFSGDNFSDTHYYQKLCNYPFFQYLLHCRKNNYEAYLPQRNCTSLMQWKFQKIMQRDIKRR